ncbi:MAG: L-rhamnose mutarotase [Ginsengibacter sp.]
MKRIASKMKLLPGFEAEYKKRHDEIWPELAALLKEAGIHEYSIFLDAAGNLFAAMQVESEVAIDNLPGHPVMKKWWDFMKDIMETNADSSPVSLPLEEVFYLP